MRPTATLLHVLTTLLLVSIPCSLPAQTMFAYDIDVSGFPTISIGLNATEDDGTPIFLTSSDLEIYDNGELVEEVIVECVNDSEESPFSAVLVNDRSGSMNWLVPTGETRIHLLRSGVAEFLDNVPFIPPTAIALTAFDAAPYLISDFQTSAPPLLAAINKLTANGGTDYNPPFLDQFVGAIALLSTRPQEHRRVIVFLTDGMSNERPDIEQIIASATDAGIQVYTITVGMPMTMDLQKIADETGGSAFGNVSNHTDIREIYRLIATRSRGLVRCRVRWNAKPACGPDGTPHDVVIRLKSRNITTQFRYIPPPGNTIGLQTTPTFLWYGSPAPPETIDRTLLLEARGGSMTVLGAFLQPIAPFEVTDWGGSEPPFLLTPGDSRTIRVRFTPGDSSLVSTQLFFDIDRCAPFPVTLTGGVEPEGMETRLDLLAPIGGEGFSACDTVLIRWSGVSPEKRIIIEYSSNDGLSWKHITDTARGLSYGWKPPALGERYRIRISVRAGDPGAITKIAGGGSGDDGDPAGNAILSSPSGIARRGDSIFLAEQGTDRVRIVDLKSGLISTLATPGTRLSNPTDVLIAGDIVFIADYGRHRILSVDLNTGLVATIAGEGQAGYGGDGGQALAASLQFPTFLALNRNQLYFAEQGNNVIRRIDLVTGRIERVAGRGTSPSEDIPALDARLESPSGIAIYNDTLYFTERNGHRVRRIDLRNGYIRTIAGNGTAGFTGDGGPASAAQLNEPLGLSTAGDRLIVSDAGNSRLRWIDLRSGIITTIAGDGTAGFTGDGGPLRLARLNRPTQTEVYKSILYISDLWANRLRAVGIPSAGSDSSASAFSVSAPAMEISQSRPLELGSVSTGVARDSLFGGLICNQGNAPMLIDSVSISGSNAEDFSIVSGVDENPILPGECREIEIRFRPGALGRRTANAVVYARCSDTASFRLAGSGLAPCGFESHPTIDLGVAVPGSAAPDSIVTSAICNNGSATLTGNVVLNPDGGAFTIVTGAGPFSLAPGECHSVTVRFEPAALGRVTSVIDYGLPTGCGSGRTLLIGRGMPDASLALTDSVRFDTRFCGSAPGDTVVRITNTGGVDLVITGVEITRNDEGFSLALPVPTESTPLIVPAGSTDSTSIRIRFDPLFPGQKSGTLFIRSNAGIEPIPVFLVGRRDSPGAEPDLTSIQFFDVDAAIYPRDTLLVVRNTGTVDLRIGGGVIDGPDAARFELDQSQFPVDLPLGASAQILVRSLAAAENGFYRAELRLGYSPQCDDSIVVTMIQGNNPPTLVPTTLLFSSLTCDAPAFADTILKIENSGGSDLVISRFAIDNDIAGTFDATFPATPVVIPPGSSIALPIRFTPAAPGSYTARILLQTNMSQSDFRYELAGRRESVSFAPALLDVRFNRIPATIPYDTIIDVRNDGTVPLTLDLPRTAGLFDMEMVGNPVIPPAGSGRMRVRFRGAPLGEYSDSTQLQESLCGLGVHITFGASVGLGLLTEVSLPVDSALPGTTARIPLTLAIPDRQLFTESGARTYTTELSFLGTVLIPDDVTRGRIIARSYDPKTRLQRVTIEGEYDLSMGDTLTELLCAVVLGDQTSTGLTYESFVWDVDRVYADTLNGAFSTHGSCFDAGLRLVAAPRVLKVVPQPMTGAGEVELELDEWATLSLELVDSRGSTVATLASGYYPAGRHTISLPVIDLASGVYTLVARTPFGQVGVQVVLQR